MAVSPAEMIVTAANGVRWRRLPGGTSSAEEFLAVLAGLGGDRIAREWSLWREGEPRREDDRRHEVLSSGSTPTRRQARTWRLRS